MVKKNKLVFGIPTTTARSQWFINTFPFQQSMRNLMQRVKSFEHGIYYWKIESI